MGRVEGKIAIVTGAASGLGAADVRLLAAEGAAVVMTDIATEAGAALAAEIGAEFVAQDVAQEASWPALVDQVVARHGGLDVLVNNAGIAPIANIETTTTEVWRRTLAIHLDATFFGCREAVRAMQASGGGSIINMSSTAALIGIPQYLAYSAAKGGIRAMTKAVAIHCRNERSGIRCNSVHPRSIDTPMVHGALRELVGIDLSAADDPEALRATLGLGEAQDVANLVSSWRQTRASTSTAPSS